MPPWVTPGLTPNRLVAKWESTSGGEGTTSCSALLKGQLALPQVVQLAIWAPFRHLAVPFAPVTGLTAA